ncbi:hypothetical protein Pst134EA_025982 [Puccinia striiformis f. sp. tritici]|uniref:hypothetical protein n=1 Tax=Puccinia striiformis f. sp. tritici TaxID=168172 RepID=UPI00200741C9|nr:hypothetical protein Pst134EA_025982 [Puccinia striiformis f. sp. tritici]KAH9452046.1 hypothetical protein Pst134EA_025982 [Puccinia striiformis f. sp. tritici]
MASLSNISPFSGEASILDDRALKLPLYTKLTGKRIVLASSSPRRLKILRDIGINPEVIPSSFEENLDHSSFEDPESPETKGLRYAAATASEKAIDVYTRLVAASPENPPDLVIGADTILQTFFPGPGELPKILEKPNSPADQLCMLEELMNAPPETRVTAVTAVAIVYTTIASPGYTVKTIGESSRLWFGDVGRESLVAYVSQGEGIDRAGGISVEGVGSQLIRRIDGDWNNVVGFPAFAFVQFLKKVMADDSDFLDD